MLRPRVLASLAGIAVTAAVSAGGAGTTAEPIVEMPGPGPLRRTRKVDEAGCARCHAAIAAEWRQSLHHAAFTDATFARAFATEPDPFCKGCHAPEGDEELGVGCGTCHVTNADVLAAPAAGSAPAPAPAPHGVTRSAAFAGAAACARCHEFDFPDRQRRAAPLAMQRTVSEHAGRGDTCAACHMPRRDGHTDHRFAASRDEGFVQSAVSVEARRSADGVEVTLTPRGLGHAFPTGDLFRRVRVTVDPATGPSTSPGASRFLARHFGTRQERPGQLVRVETSDDRVIEGPRVVTLPASTAAVRVRVVYERAEGASAPTSSRATVAGAITLFDREL